MQMDHLTKNQSGPTLHARCKAFEEYLMKEQNSLAVQKDGVHVFMGAWWLLRTGGHFERSQETRDQHFHLFHILFFSFYHSEHQAANKHL
jgi:hypothetical protein